MMRVFAFLALAAADALAKDTLAEMTAAIAAGEYASNFFTGDDNADIENTPRSQLMHDCVRDKLLRQLKPIAFPRELAEEPILIEDDLLVGLAACCVPPQPKPNKPELVPGCVPGLEEGYKILREATHPKEIGEAATIINTYKKQILKQMKDEL
jgi:hypothetical protein